MPNRSVQLSLIQENYTTVILAPANMDNLGDESLRNNYNELSRLSTGEDPVDAIFADTSVSTTRPAENRSPKRPTPITLVYKCPKSFEPAVGDIFVVPNSNSVQVMVCIQVHDEPEIDLAATFMYKWVMSKLDLTEYSNLVSRELEMARHLENHEKREKTAEVRRALIDSLGDFGEKLVSMGKV